MLKGIFDLAYLLGVDPFWVILLLILILVLEIVKCIYPWQPEWKAKTTEDKNGNKVTKYYRLKK